MSKRKLPTLVIYVIIDAVYLGIGLPTMVADIPEGIGLHFRSNSILGMGPLAGEGLCNKYLINSGGQNLIV